MTPEQLAEQHWEFIQEWLHMIYVGAFVHGFKHGTQAALACELRLKGEPSESRD